MNYLNGAIALVALGLGIHSFIVGEWVAAVLLILCAAYCAWAVDWRDKHATREVEDVPLPEYDTQTDILRRGHEPVETPTEEETRMVRAAWEKHVDRCPGCIEYYRLKKESGQ